MFLLYIAAPIPKHATSSRPHVMYVFILYCIIIMMKSVIVGRAIFYNNKRYQIKFWNVYQFENDTGWCFETEPQVFSVFGQNEASRGLFV